VTATNLQVTNIKANDGTAVAVLTDSTGALDISKAVTFSATTQNISLGASQTTGTFVLGGTAATGAITLDQSTKAHTLNIGSGATENATTKTINIGTGGVSGSTTTITIGSSNGTTTTFNGTVNVTTLDLTNLEVTNIKAKDGTAAIVLTDSTGAVAISTNLTIGDASGDTLTINGTAVSTPNGLNFDSDTLVIDAANNRVGIGTSSPATKLQVTTASGDSKIRISSGSNTLTFGWDEPNGFVYAAVGGYQAWQIGGTTRMLLDTSGNLGLGVTTLSPWGDMKAMQINAYGSAIAAWNTNRNTYILSNAYYDTSFKFSTTATASAVYYNASGETGVHSWHTAGAAAARTANDPISFNQAMTLDADGDLGIGTSSPNAKLHILAADTVTADLARFQQTNQGNLLIQSQQGGLNLGSANGILFSNATGNMGWRTNASSGDANMLLDQSGNLGLGVTPSAWNSNRKAIQTGNASLFSAPSAASYAAVGANVFNNSGGTDTYISSAAASLYLQNAGAHAWSVAASGTAGNAISFTQAMTLDASGNLGVGATSSLKKLTVKGSTTDRTVEVIDDGSNDAAIMLQLSGAQEFTLGVDRTDNSFRIADGGALGSNDRLVIDSSGNLLVGKSATGSANGWTLYPNGNGDAIFTMASTNEIFLWNNTSTSGSAIIDFRTGNVSKGKIQWDNAATLYVTTSDYRLKEKISPIADALAKVARLKPVTYTWKTNGAISEGFIAHELAEVMPQCVTGVKDAVNEDGSIKPQGIDTSFLVATLAAAIQEQQAMINELKAEVAALKGA
jgi:hypothetical protein